MYAGNRVLHEMTSTEPQELRVELQDFSGNTAYAQYSTFSVAPESNNFRLTVSGYSGTAGEY